METNSKMDDHQQEDKKFPGLTSDTDQDLTDKEKDERLAESGPVRNPNYHDMNHDDDTSLKSANRYRKDIHNHKPAGSDGKTLEDFNDVEPKRDINKTANNEIGSRKE